MGQQQSTQAHGGTMGQKQSTQAHGGKPRPESATPDCDLELFLVGKTGHGKSATGNTVLGESIFSTSDMGESTTLSTDVAWRIRDGLTVKVVDGPGLLDTRFDMEEALIKMEQNLVEGFVQSPKGFHAIVLVLSYGMRYTEEEKNTVALLKGMLQKNVIREHSILVFTHGDSFVLNNRDETFEDWCKNQKGDLRELMKECGDRVVLFHNLEPEKGEKSTRKLITLARKLGQRYTPEMFDSIADERSKFIKEQGAIQLKAKIQSKINLIIGFLKSEDKGQLEHLLDELKKDIDKETLNPTTVEKIRKGITQARNKEYTEALETFEEIEIEGKKFLQQFMHTVVVVVRDFLVPTIQIIREIAAR